MESVECTREKNINLDANDEKAQFCCEKCYGNMSYFVDECYDLSLRNANYKKKYHKLAEKFKPLQKSKELALFEFEEMKAQKEDIESRYNLLIEMLKKKQNTPDSSQAATKIVPIKEDKETNTNIENCINKHPESVEVNLLLENMISRIEMTFLDQNEDIRGMLFNSKNQNLILGNQLEHINKINEELRLNDSLLKDQLANLNLQLISSKEEIKFLQNELSTQSRLIENLKTDLSRKEQVSSKTETVNVEQSLICFQDEAAKEIVLTTTTTFESILDQPNNLIIDQQNYLEELNNLKDVNEKYLSEINALKEEISQLNQTNNDLNNNFNNEMQQLKSEHAKLFETYNLRTNELKSMEENLYTQINKFNSQLNEKNEIIDKLNSEFTAKVSLMENDRKFFNESLKQMEQERNHYQLNEQNFKTQINDLVIQLSESNNVANQQFNQKQQCQETMERQIEELSNRLNESDIHMKEIDLKLQTERQENIKLSDVLNTKDAEMADLKTKFQSEFDACYKSYCEEVARLNNEIATRSSESENLKMQLENLIANEQNLKQINVNLNASHNELAFKLNEVIKMNSNLKQAEEYLVNKANEANQKFMHSIEQINKLKNHINEQKNTIDYLQQKTDQNNDTQNIDIVRQVLEQIIYKVEENFNEQDSTSDLINQYQCEINELRVKLNALQEANIINETNFNNRIKNLDSELVNLIQNKNLSEEKISSLINKNNELESVCQDLKADLIDLTNSKNTEIEQIKVDFMTKLECASRELLDLKETNQRYIKDIEISNANINDLNMLINNFQTNESNLNLRINELSEQVDNLNSTRCDLITQLNDIIQLNEKLKVNLENSDIKVNEMVQRSELSEQIFIKYKADLESKETLLNELNNKLFNLEEELNVFKTNEDAVSLKISNLNMQISESNALNEKYKCDLEVQKNLFDKDKQSFAESLKNMEIERCSLVENEQNLKNQINDLTNQLTQMNNIIEQYKSNEISSKNQIDELNSHIEQLKTDKDQSSNELILLKEDIFMVKSNMNELGQINEEIRLKNDSLNIKIMNLDQINNELKKNEYELGLKVTELEKELGKSFQIIEKLKHDSNNELNKYQEEHRKFKELKRENEQLLIKLKDYDNLKRLELADLKNDYETTIINLTDNNKDLSDKLGKSERLVENLTNENKQFETEVLELRRQLASSEEEIESLKLENKGKYESLINEKEKKAYEFELKYNDAFNQCNLLREQLEKKTKIINEKELKTNENIFKFNSEIESLQMKYKDSEIKLRSAENMLDEKSKQLDELKSRYSKESDLRGEVEFKYKNLADELNIYKSKCSDLNATCDSLNNEKSRLEDQLQIASSEMIEIQTRLCRALEDKDELNNHLIELNKKNEQKFKEQTHSSIQLQNQIEQYRLQLEEQRLMHYEETEKLKAKISCQVKTPEFSKSFYSKISDKIDNNLHQKLDELVEENHKQLNEINKLKSENNDFKSRIEEIEKQANDPENKKLGKDQIKAYEKKLKKQEKEIKDLKNLTKEMEDTNKFLSKEIDRYNEMIYEMTNKENSKADESPVASSKKTSIPSEANNEPLTPLTNANSRIIATPLTNKRLQVNSSQAATPSKCAQQ